jgi:hypothetical protein
LRDQIVRVAFGAAAPVLGAVTILATPGAGVRPAASLCVAEDEAIPRAYAAVLGIAPAAMAGTQVLVDGQGWLRAVQAPGALPGWNDPGVLAAELQEIAAHPLATTTGGAGGMDHNMRM